MSKPLILEQFLPVQLVNLSKHVSDAFAQMYSEEFDLSIGEWRVMAHLGEQPGRSSIDLIRLTSLDKSMISRIAKDMEKRGLVCREKSARDSRVSILMLTPEGSTIYQQIAPRALAWEEELLSSLNAVDYRDLQRIMSLLQNKLSDMESTGS